VIRDSAHYYEGIEELEVARRPLAQRTSRRRFSAIDGNVYHVDPVITRLGPRRPAPGFAGYRTPVPGLFLSGSGGPHPIAGINGLPGKLAAETMIKYLRTEDRHGRHAAHSGRPGPARDWRSGRSRPSETPERAARDGGVRTAASARRVGPAGQAGGSARCLRRSSVNSVVLEADERGAQLLGQGGLAVELAVPLEETCGRCRSPVAAGRCPITGGRGNGIGSTNS